MKYVILAAGQGSRLKSVAELKPLARLLGLTLLERAVNLAREAGFTDIYVVLGYEADRIKEFITKKKLPVRVVHNSNWQQGNGTSVAAVRQLIDDEDFIIAMADHIASPELVKQIAQASLDECDIVLAADPTPDDHLDLDDATRVKLNEDKIEAIGKNLTSWDAIDTGFFKASPRFFSYFDQPDFDGSLSSAVQLAASEGRARALLVHSTWIDVDSPDAFKKAENLLLKNLAKPTDGPISRWLNRPLSTRLSRLLVRTSLTPNQISVFSFLLSAAAAVLMSLPRYAALAAGGVLAQLSSIIDGCDGEVARLKNLTSEFGAWFDAVLDRYADFLLIAGLSLNALHTHAPVLTLAASLLALSGSFINSYTADKYDAYLRKKGGVGLRLGRDVRIFIIFTGAVLNVSLLTLVLLAVINHFEVLRRVLMLSRHARQSI